MTTSGTTNGEHRRTAEALAALVSRDADLPPHPYVRRYLVEHAARGGVLDDEHVPGHFLPWETSGSVRGQLGMPIAEDPSRRTLVAWACIEAFLGDVGVESRQVSLAVVCRAFGAPLPDGNRRVEPLWVSWSMAGNVLLSGEFPIWAMTSVPLPDGRILLATASRARTVTLVDPSTGNRVGDPLTGHSGSVRTLATLPGDVPLLATGSDDGTIRLWDPATGTSSGPPLIGHDRPVIALAVVPGPHGRPLLASAGADRTVRVWDLANRHEAVPPIHTGWARAIAAVPQPDGTPLLAVAGVDEHVRLWDPLTGVAHEPLVGHTEVTSALAVLPGALLASASYDGTIRLWNLLDKQPIGRPLHDHSGGPVFCLVAVPFPDGRTILLSAHADGAVRLWDPMTGEQTGDPVLAHVRPVRAMTLVPATDGRALVSTASWAARVWDPAVPQRAWADPSTQADLVAVLPLPDGDPVVATARGTDVDLWDVGDGWREHRTSFGHTGRVQAVGTLTRPSAGTCLVTGDDDGAVRLWDPATREPVPARIRRHPEGVLAVTGLPTADGRTLLAVSCGRTVFLWDPETGESAGRPIGYPLPVCALAAVPGPDGRMLLAAASGRVVHLSEAGMRPGVALVGHGDRVNALAVVELPDTTRVLVSAGDDRTLRRWDPLTARPIGEPLVGHKGQVRALATVGTTLASASFDGTIRLWDPTLGKGDVVVVLGGALSGLAMAASADTAILAAGGPAGLVVLTVRG